MKNFVQRDDAIHSVLANTVKGGDLIIIGSVIGVAMSDGDGTNLVTVKTEGVYSLPKAVEAITQGAKVYWDGTNKNVTATATSNTYIGYAWEDAASADTALDVCLANGI